MLNGSGGWRGMTRKPLAGVVLLGSMAASYFGLSIWQQHRGSGATVSRADSAGARSLVNPFASANGMHLIAFVVTASDCGWSTQTKTMEAVGSIRSKLRSAHGGSYAQITVIGVALDEDLDEGLRFLSDIGKGALSGAFDQIIVGGSWLNEQVVRFVWREHIIEAASPQIVVLERPVNTEAYLASSTIGVQNDRILTNPTGSAQIVQWIKDGVALDYSPFGKTPSAETPK